MEGDLSLVEEEEDQQGRVWLQVPVLLLVAGVSSPQVLLSLAEDHLRPRLQPDRFRLLWLFFNPLYRQ